MLQSNARIPWDNPTTNGNLCHICDSKWSYHEDYEVVTHDVLFERKKKKMSMDLHIDMRCMFTIFFFKSAWTWGGGSLMPTLLGVELSILCCISVVCGMSYFPSFLRVVAWGNLSLQYMNSIKCIFKLGWGVNGACHWVLCQECIVCSIAVWRGIYTLGGSMCMKGAMMVLYSLTYGWILPAFMSVKHLVMGWASRVATSMWTTLLCLFVRRLFMCWFIQHDRRCKHVLFSFRGHMLHTVKISYFEYVFQW